ncbi:hypothetical protein LEMLEM_LOCUS13135, partial [Lemmus lemmus]
MKYHCTMLLVARGRADVCDLCCCWRKRCLWSVLPLDA